MQLLSPKGDIVSPILFLPKLQPGVPISLRTLYMLQALVSFLLSLPYFLILARSLCVSHSPFFFITIADQQALTDLLLASDLSIIQEAYPVLPPKCLDGLLSLLCGTAFTPCITISYEVENSSMADSYTSFSNISVSLPVFPCKSFCTQVNLDCQAFFGNISQSVTLSPLLSLLCLSAFSSFYLISFVCRIPFVFLTFRLFSLLLSPRSPFSRFLHLFPTYVFTILCPSPHVSLFSSQ